MNCRPLLGLALAFAFATLALPVVAQRQLAPRAFLPTDYQAELFVDLVAMRDTEFLDVIERSLPYRTIRSQLRGRLGLDIEDLDRVRLASKLGGGETMTRVVILEGNAKLRLPAGDGQEEIEGYMVTRESDYRGDTLWARPRSGLLVYGSAAVVAPVLRRTRQGGVPHPDLMALTAARAAPLLHFAAARCGIDDVRWRDLAGLPDAWLDADDPAEAFVLRFAENEQQHLVVSAMVRFGHGGVGPARFEAGLREAVKEFGTTPVLRPLVELVARIKFEIRDTDLLLMLDLGPAKQAGKTMNELSTVALGALFTGRSVEQAVPLPVPVEVKAVDLPAKPKRARGDKKT